MENLQRNTIYVGHVLDVLRKIPSESVDSALFSQPYWGVRDYTKDDQGQEVVTPVIWDGDPTCQHEKWNVIRANRKATPGDIPGPGSRQASRRTPAENRAGKDSEFCDKCGAWRGDLGNEPTVQLYVQHMVDICREVLRTLKPWGIMVMNVGDTFSGSGGAGGRWSTGARAHQKWRQPPQPGSKGSLILVPHRLGIALRDQLDVIVMNDVIWRKENAGMHPDYLRFGTQHEHVFFIAKSERTHFYVNKRTMHSQRQKPLGTKGAKDVDWTYKSHVSCKGQGCQRCENGMRRVSLWKPYKRYFNQMLVDLKHPNIKGGHKFGGNKAPAYGNPTLSGNEYDATRLEGRNMCDVWDIPVSHYKGSHTAAWPPEIARRILDAICPREACTACGLPRVRMGRARWSDCGCGAPFQHGHALEPFNGAGSTMVAAQQLGTIDVTGIEIKLQYAQEAKARVEGTAVGAGQAKLDMYVEEPKKAPLAFSLEAFCKQQG